MNEKTYPIDELLESIKIIEMYAEAGKRAVQTAYENTSDEETAFQLGRVSLTADLISISVINIRQRAQFFKELSDREENLKKIGVLINPPDRCSNAGDSEMPF